MVILLLYSVFFLFVFVESLKQKKYRYAAAAAFTLLYFVFVRAQGSPEAWSWIQKIVLLILAVYWLIVFIKSSDRKKDLPAVIFSCIACVFRFIRTLIFDYYTSNMKSPGADIQIIYQKFTDIYAIVDAVTNFALLLMLFSMALQLGKTKAANKNN